MSGVGCTLSSHRRAWYRHVLPLPVDLMVVRRLYLTSATLSVDCSNDPTFRWAKYLGRLATDTETCA